MIQEINPSPGKGFPDCAVGKILPANARDIRHLSSIPGLGRFPWNIFLPGKFHGQRSLVGTIHRVAESVTPEHITHRSSWTSTCRSYITPVCLGLPCFKMSSAAGNSLSLRKTRKAGYPINVGSGFFIPSPWTCSWHHQTSYTFNRPEWSIFQVICSNVESIISQSILYRRNNFI